MSLKITGQSGGPTELSASDDQFGVMTQVPENAVFHSPAGLKGADGNTAFGGTFTLAAYFEQTTDATTTVTLCNADAPYKFRILSCTARCIDDANGAVRSPAGMASLAVNTNTSGQEAAFAADLKGMRPGEMRDVPGNTTDADEVSTNGSLTVAMKTRVPATGVTNTLKTLVELTCMRVV